MSAWLLTVCRGPQDENQEKMAEWEYRSNFGRKNIQIKYQLFDTVFYANSEYHGYVALESTFDGQNIEIKYEKKKIYAKIG